MSINPSADINALRNQQSLAMSANAAAPADPAAQAAAQAAATPGAAGDASIGAAAVQAPPSTSKIILQSVLKGAVTGVSVSLGVKSFAPFLSKIPMIGPFMAKVPGLISKIPLVGGLFSKVLKFAGKGALQGFLVTALVGAAVGAIGGAISGLGKAKKAATEYAEAQAKAQAQAAAQQQAQQQAQQAPAEPSAKAMTKPVAKAVKPRFKSWVVARSGSKYGTQKFGSYTTKGESMQTLCARFHTTPDEIRKLNPSITGDSVPSGTKLKLARKVVPNAKAWRG